MTLTHAVETVGSANARRVMDHVQRLTALGDRFAGQAGDGPATDYVEECLRSYRLEIERAASRFVTFRERHCALT
ncbi:MAG: hypothetical protein WAU75_12755, partial [Solirubrobacteraceae bacterium]